MVWGFGWCECSVGRVVCCEYEYEGLVWVWMVSFGVESVWCVCLGDEEKLIVGGLVFDCLFGFGVVGSSYDRVFVYL